MSYIFVLWNRDDNGHKFRNFEYLEGIHNFNFSSDFGAVCFIELMVKIAAGPI